jgi:hypothetical protein
MHIPSRRPASATCNPGMFFRRKASPSGRCLQLLEAYRSAQGQPRQRVVVSLGDAAIAENERAAIAQAMATRRISPSTGWKRPHRFVVVRRPILEDPQEAQRLTLFKDRRCAYHVFVTHPNLGTWRDYLFYNGRASIEKSNREFLYDCPLGKIPTRSSTADVAFFQLLLLAANLVHWFKRLCLPLTYGRATLDTIRTDFLVLPAKLVRQSKKNIVKLPHDYHYQRQFLQAERAIARLRVPGKFRICRWPRRL